MDKEYSQVINKLKENVSTETKIKKVHAGYINGLYIRSLDHGVMYEVLLALEKKSIIRIHAPFGGHELSFNLKHKDGSIMKSYKGTKLRYDLDFQVTFLNDSESNVSTYADFKGRVSGTNNHEFQLFWLKKLNVEDHEEIIIEIWTTKTTKEFAKLLDLDIKEIKKSLQSRWTEEALERA